MKKGLLGLVFLMFSELTAGQIVVGAERMERYLPRLKGKRVGVVTNQTGVVGERHLVDTLLALGVGVEAIFAPEHGFRGTAAAGEKVNSGVDRRTGLPIVSLYGANRRPSTADMARCDVYLFDIQDVGCRFYTYLSTMHLMMEACAEAKKPLIILDRPNPNSRIVDGPTLDLKHKSFVGMHPIPVLHGMTLGEMAQMINGEKWLTGGFKCDLTVVTCTGWRRGMEYELPIAPSPALPNSRAVELYPSLCFFEATPIDLGRGTDAPFQRLTYPNGVVVDLREGARREGIDLSYLIEAQRVIGNNPRFLSSFFERLTGVDWVREMIDRGASAEEIRARWAPDVAKFEAARKPYLLYE